MYQWLIVIFGFLLIESLTMNLVTIWFAFGALCSFVSSYFTNNLILQLIIFIVMTTLSLIFTKPIFDKYVKKKSEKTNLDMIIGKIGIAKTDIEPLKKGRVYICGKEWMAVSDEKIKKDEKVEALRIEGAKIIVKRKEK